MKRFSFLYYTTSHPEGLIARLFLFLVLFPHGSQLLFGWFGGYGFNDSMNYLATVEGLPWLISFFVILLQFFGSLALLAGWCGRFFAGAMTLLFVGMVVTSHWTYGFFMNWSGQQAGEGFEYHLLAIGLCIVLFVKGSGACSIDATLSGRIAAQKKPLLHSVNSYV